MNARPTQDAGYSPSITMELLLHGGRFNVASMGAGQLSLRDARRSDPGRGTVRVVIDGCTTLFHVDLPNGINPDSAAQDFLLIETVREAAA
jgi:hypothetical protein